MVGRRKYLGTNFLSPIQLEHVYYLWRGLSNQEIADTRFVDIGSVKFMHTGIYKKFGVNSRARLIALYLERKLPPETQLQVDQYFLEKSRSEGA